MLFMELSDQKKKIISQLCEKSLGENADKIIAVQRQVFSNIDLMNDYISYHIKDSFGKDCIVEEDEKTRKTTCTYEIKIKDLVDYIKCLEEEIKERKEENKKQWNKPWNNINYKEHSPIPYEPTIIPREYLFDKDCVKGVAINNNIEQRITVFDILDLND